MKLIADSGSTKTDWSLVDDGVEVLRIKTIGLNPYLNTSVAIQEVLKRDVFFKVKNYTIDSIAFYGAGCSSSVKSKEVSLALRNLFTSSAITVDHDLLGAAKAVCGDAAGIAVILGTGSNSCYYDGFKIIKNVRSLGFILGDEGSGCYIGKQLMSDFLNEDMPEHISQLLASELELTPEIIFDNVYKKPLPNRYLASFGTWIHSHYENESYLYGLVENAFEDFFKQHIVKYKNYQNTQINVVGSIGYHFQDVLEKVALKFDCKLGKVLKSPIEGLINV